MSADRSTATERERCARIVEGEVYKELYREWPGIGWGNRASDSELVRFADALAARIRSGESASVKE